MTKLIYGVDPNGEITSLAVRDAIVQCFFEAHCKDSEIDTNDSEMGLIYCRDLVRKAFVDTGGDFDNPEKDSIIKVIDWLKDFSKKFRDQEVILDHAKEIMNLVDKIQNA